MINNQHKLGLCMNLILHLKALESICMCLEIFCMQQQINSPNRMRSFQNKCLQLSSIRTHHLCLHYCKLSTLCMMSMQPELHNLYLQPHIQTKYYIRCYQLYQYKLLTYTYQQYYHKCKFHQFLGSKKKQKGIMHKSSQRCMLIDLLCSQFMLSNNLSQLPSECLYKFNPYIQLLIYPMYKSSLFYLNSNL